MPTGVQIDYYKDNIDFGASDTLEGQQFGVATGSLGLIAGIMGLAPDLYNGFVINESYPLVLDSLVAQGKISSRAYSIDMGHSGDDTGKLGFTGIHSTWMQNA